MVARRGAATTTPARAFRGCCTSRLPAAPTATCSGLMARSGRAAPNRSTMTTALQLADKAERGDLSAAYELAMLLRPESIVELIDFVAPASPITTKGFDALADGLFLFNYAKEKP